MVWPGIYLENEAPGSAWMVGMWMGVDWTTRTALQVGLEWLVSNP